MSNYTLSAEELEKEATITRLLNSGNVNDIEKLIFRTGEKMEKSARPPQSQSNNEKSKNKKNKGNKNK